MMEFISFVIDRWEEIFSLLIEHIQLTAVSVAIAILIGVPIGILISRYKHIHRPVMGVVNILQAIPSMAVLGFLIPFLGIGKAPAIFMVVLYSLMPIIKNTSTGILNIQKETLETAKAIGMTKLQILGRVQFPIALPVIMAGIRISAVTSVGLMTLASFIGAGGLGYLIYSGVQMVNSYMVLAGALPACMLALFMDFFFSKIEKTVTPISLRLGNPLPDSKEKLLYLKKERKIFLFIAASMMFLLILFVVFSSRVSEEKVVTITSKTYPEQILIGNMIADIIEDKTDITVIRKLSMGGTQICFEAIVSGEVDIQVDYTGTIFPFILQQGLSKDVQFIYDTIKSMYSNDYGLAVLDQLGFNNRFALAVRQDTAEKFNLETISDVATVSNQLILAPGFEFNNREDGIIGLSKVYPLNFKDIIPLNEGLKYEAINSNDCDVIVAYTTDGLVHKYDLKLLEDDKKFFLDYFAVPIVREDTLKKYPELKDVMNTLSGKLTNEIMSELNYRIEVNGEKPEEVSKDFLIKTGYISE